MHGRADLKVNQCVCVCVCRNCTANAHLIARPNCKVILTATPNCKAILTPPSCCVLSLFLHKLFPQAVPTQAVYSVLTRLLVSEHCLMLKQRHWGVEHFQCKSNTGCCQQCCSTSGMLAKWKRHVCCKLQLHLLCVDVDLLQASQPLLLKSILSMAADIIMRMIVSSEVQAECSATSHWVVQCLVLPSVANTTWFEAITSCFIACLFACCPAGSVRSQLA